MAARLENHSTLKVALVPGFMMPTASRVVVPFAASHRSAAAMAAADACLYRNCMLALAKLQVMCPPGLATQESSIPQYHETPLAFPCHVQIS